MSYTRNFIVACFYTYDTPYEEESKGLELTAQEYGIKVIRKGYQNRGSWVENCAIKPQFILDTLETQKLNVLYLDADARIRQDPILIDQLDCDVAYHLRRGCELLSGTLFFKQSAAAKALLTRWLTLQSKKPYDWDQRVLQQIIDQHGQNATIANLPPAYCQIFDSMKHHGEPVIEHMQASRRYKKLVTLPSEVTQIPKEIYGQRIRQGEDGCLFLVRKNFKAEAWLDTHFSRCGPLQWRPRFLSDHRMDDFAPVFNERPVYIVGKGPSLDHVTKENFAEHPESPVIALNEAIFKIESLNLPNPTFALQQDAKLRNKCLPHCSPIFVSSKAANYYAQEERAYLFENKRLGLSPSALSVSAAMVISRYLGSNKYIMVCFDSCVNKELTYAKCIGYDSTWGGSPNRFLGHRRRIERRADGLPLEWIIPQ